MSLHIIDPNGDNSACGHVMQELLEAYTDLGSNDATYYGYTLGIDFVRYALLNGTPVGDERGLVQIDLKLVKSFFASRVKQTLAFLKVSGPECDTMCIKGPKVYEQRIRKAAQEIIVQNRMDGYFHSGE